MVLLPQPFRSCGVKEEFVHTLADLRVRYRKEIGRNALVERHPGHTPIVRAERAAPQSGRHTCVGRRWDQAGSSGNTDHQRREATGHASGVRECRGWPARSRHHRQSGRGRRDLLRGRASRARAAGRVRYATSRSRLTPNLPANRAASIASKSCRHPLSVERLGRTYSGLPLRR